MNVRNVKVISYIFLIVSVVYSISFCFWNFSNDTFYWRNIAVNNYPSYMSILTVKLNEIWLEATSDNLICQKLLGWMCITCSLIASYFIMVPKIEYIKYIWCLGVGFILMGYGTFQLYNPDSLTVMFTVLSTCFMWKYYKKEKEYYALQCFILLAIATSARLPNIVALPILASMYIYTCNKKIGRRIVQLGLYGIIGGVVYSALTIILSGRTDLFNYAYDGIVNHKVGASSHSMSNLIIAYINSFIKVGTHTLYVLVPCIAYCLLYKKTNLLRSPFSLIGFTTIIVVILKYTSMSFFDQSFNMIYSFFVVCSILFILYKTTDIGERVLWLFIMSMGVVGIAGSDTGMLKLFPYYAAITPAVLVTLYKIPEYRKPLFCAIVPALMIYSVFAYSRDCRINTETINCPMMKNSLTTISQKKSIEENIKVYNTYGIKNHVIFYGPQAHYMYAVTQSALLYEYSYWMNPDDMDEIGTITQIFKKDDMCTLIDYSKSVLLNEMMCKIGVKPIVTSDFNIYTH